MYNLQDIEDKIFFECKNILDTLAKINSIDELLSKQDLFYEVSERIAFLKVLEKNENFSEMLSRVNTSENAALASVSGMENKESSYLNTKEDIVEEEVLFTNQLNDIDADEFEVEDPDNAGDTSVALDAVGVELEMQVETNLVDDEEREISIETEPSEQVETSENEEKSENDLFLENEPVFSFVADFPTVEETTSDTEIEAKAEVLENVLEESQDDDLKIPDPESVISENKPTVAEMHVSEHQEQVDGKIKLANIKALKNIESLFGEEHFEAATESDNLNSTVSSSFETPSVTKSRQEFKLDLNDKLAFSKMLFNGSQGDLNDTIRILNTFDDVEQAKVYLSDLYYDRNWDKVDEYAQRLWTLVENKFL